MEGIGLKKLGNHDNRGAFGCSAYDLIRRGHTKLGVAKLELLDRISFRAALLDGYLQSMVCKSAVCVGVEVTHYTGVKEPFEPIGHIFQTFFGFPATTTRTQCRYR